MKVIRLKDNTLTSKTVLDEIPNLTERVANKTLDQLEQEGIFVFPEIVSESKDITEEQMILQKVNNSFRTENVMGYLGYGNERMIIESRFCKQNEDYFFRYLLEKVLDFPNIIDLKSDTDQDNRLLNYLLFLFPYYLRTAMRKGLYKQYSCHRYNDGNVKGTVDIARHIRKNTPFIGNIAYSQRELSYDNDLIELVRHTIEFIKGKSYGRQLLSRVKDEVRIVNEATKDYNFFDRQRIIDTNTNNKIRHAYYREYSALQRLCLLILQHRKHQIGAGSWQIYGILFDGAWLWEEYMASVIGKRFYHPQNKAKKDGQLLFKGCGKIYPDFISRDSKDRVVADAKYKPIGNIGNDDYLQVLAYMFRFNAKTGFCLYPDSENTGDKRLWLNSGTTFEANVTKRDDFCLIKRGLRIPVNAESYDEFAAMMQDNEIEFRRRFG